MSSILPNPQSNLHFQALQKTGFADHIKQMANLMHADAVQQLEVTLLGLPVAEVIDLLSTGLSESKLTAVTAAQPHPHTCSSSFCSCSWSLGIYPVPVMATMESKPIGRYSNNFENHQSEDF